MMKLNWREKFAAYLLLIVGILYLALWFVSIFSGVSNRSTSGQEDKIIISKSEMLSNIRTIISFSVFLLAGILLLKKQRLGWIMGLSIILIYIIISTGILVQLIGSDENFVAGVLGFGLVLLVCSFIFLLPASTQKKFMVSRNSYLLTIGFSALLGIIYFI